MQPSAARHLVPTVDRPPSAMARGRGSWLRDEAGRRYLDLVQGWAVNALGHSPPAVVRAIARQARELLNPSPAFFNAPHLRLVERLALATGLDRCFVASTGAEANECAIKLARKHGAERGAHEIVTFTGAFHGRTLATMSASGKPEWDPLFEPKVPGFVRAPHDLDAVARLVGPRTCAVMLEPIQGEGGVVPFGDDFLRGLRALTSERGVLLIADEIQTGVGRTGRFLACDHAGVRPDILTLGKGLGGGVPIGVALVADAACRAGPGEHGGTFSNHPLACAAANAVLDAVLAPGFLAGVERRGAALRDGLAALAATRALPPPRGRGLLLALDLVRPIAFDVVARARDAGLLVNAPRPHLLRFMPALTISEREIARALAVIERVLP